MSDSTDSQPTVPLPDPFSTTETTPLTARTIPLATEHTPLTTEPIPLATEHTLLATEPTSLATEHTPPTAPTALLTASLARPPRAHIRFGAIVWGLIVSAIAIVTLTIVAVPYRRDNFTQWVNGLQPGTIWLLVLIGVGAAILLIALLAGIRSAQRRV